MTTIFTIPAGETFQSFAQLNNILIVITDLNRYFLLYDVDTGTYSELEEIPMPDLYVGAKEFYETDTSGDAKSTFAEAYSDLVSAMQTHKGQGYVQKYSYTFAIFAFKLFDGSYVKHSSPIFIYSLPIDSNADGSIQNAQVRTQNGGAEYFARTTFYAPEYYFYLTTEQKNILNDYKGIIQSLCLFVTNPIEEYSDYPSDVNLWTNDGSDQFTPPLRYSDTITAKEIFESASLYYKAKEISFDELVGDDLTDAVEFGIMPLITTNETLPIDNFTHHTIWGSKNYNYNSRLHLGDITTKFYKGHNPIFTPKSYTETTSSDLYYTYKVYIKTDGGEKIVITSEKNILPLALIKDLDIIYNWKYAGDTNVLLLNSIVSYPDPRAYKMKIIVEDKDTDPDNYYSSTEFDIELKPHPFLNISYSIPSLTPFSNGTVWIHSRWDLFVRKIITGETFDVAESIVESYYFNDPNRVQVSRLDNALVYEATNSYQIGNDDETILGFGSVVEPLSDGQFGAFPLYIFTTAGIFVLQQGSGLILYSNILPLNKEVCNNHLSITDIGGGVVYSTVKGLNILSGRQITEISQFLEGEPKEYLVDNETYQDYLGDVNFVNLLTELSTVDFKTYLENAIIGFDHVNKEIVVSNDTYTFSYVYNLESKMWHKISEVYTEFVKVIPKTYGYKSGIFYDLTDEEFDYIETLIQTRPIKLDSLNIKAIERLILRGYFDVKDLTYSAVLLFGTIDSKSYVFLCGKSPRDDSTFQDVLIKNSHVGFKYFILVYVGQIKDSSINFIEVSYAERWNNKLR